MFKKFFLTTLLVVGMAVFASNAQANIYSFFKLTNNGNPDVSSQLSVDVTAGGGGTVDFKFFNNVGIESSIADIYFDDGTLLAIASITDSGGGVAFSDPATPGNLPGGNLATPPFVTTADFSADSDAPVSENGVNASTEWVNINFTLQGGQTFADTIASLETGALRIGLHVQSIGEPGGSDGYINSTGGAVPEPGALAIWGAGFLVVGVVSLRKRRRS